MRGTLRRTRMKDWYEIIRETCPICGKSGGCMLHSDGNRVVCIRVESKIIFSKKMTSWLHFLKEPVSKEKNLEEYILESEKAPVQQLNAVYGAMLENTYLQDVHHEHLTGPSRSMQEKEIHHRKYRTFPAKSWDTTKAMLNHVSEEAFEGVPGFFKNKYGWMIAGAPGILIPYRNTRNQLTGFQIRVDNPGFKAVLEGTFNDHVTAEIIEKPNKVQVKIDGEVYKEEYLSEGERITIMTNGNYGSVCLKKGQRYFWLSSANKEQGTGAGNPLPVHVAVPVSQLQDWEEGEIHQTDSVWITEGALKADIAVEHMARLYKSGQIIDQEKTPTFIGLPGVSTWFNVMEVLEEMNTRIVTLAYDMDMLSNPDVLRPLKDFITHLKSEGYEVRMAMWNEEDGKGIDDMFLNSKFPQIKEF
ncbi:MULTISPECIES: DUF3854 domain-containing protein [unclassified Planococcus (in: firmicutes)]|uniref:DUF3854 domain-containing protein n=1 Tax=unclassified Planococcus (in: firmicutes) TaxID=2662419 RepID=UPI000C34E81C|nr:MULTISPECIES: DUF3854 domain-containing protein [unclassified Planococcus (in: firmicutes)]AUD12320.1 hypothetical protein CW734_00120 [Planococcus sp. MB-3u-03]PKG46596.1 hypothetical protein CXF66_06895 [Planococcus sp. Urea-trap-24]PKG89718.1 hypothetical protein CXF91_05910 [Planococcus sp. Urea-3u-39]PKH40879.1 hypothetical protein CXF77_07485 [Planococcus sp. MB-3u-09]